MCRLIHFACSNWICLPFMTLEVSSFDTFLMNDEVLAFKYLC